MPKKNQLQVIIKESGLETTKARVIFNKFKDSFDIAEEWEIKARAIVVTKDTQLAEMQMARTGRLFLQKRRGEIEKVRKAMKEDILREGKAIDGIANVLKGLIVPIEKYLESQEKFVEIREAAKTEAKRIEDEKKLEKLRIEEERLDKLHSERINKALPYRDFWKEGEYDFRKMSQEGFLSLIHNLKRRKENYDAEQQKIRDDNERLKKEAEDREAKIAKERKAKNLKLANQKAKADKEKAALEKKAREEKEALEAKAKKDREDEQRKTEAERKEKERLAALLASQVECPKCHHKFLPNKEK